MSKKGFYSTVGIIALLGASAAVGVSVVMSRRSQEKKARLVDKKKDLKRLTVQEAQNAKLGQGGVIYIDDTVLIRETKKIKNNNIFIGIS